MQQQHSGSHQHSVNNMIVFNDENGFISPRPKNPEIPVIFNEASKHVDQDEEEDSDDLLSKSMRERFVILTEFTPVLMAFDLLGVHVDRLNLEKPTKSRLGYFARCWRLVVWSGLTSYCLGIIFFLCGLSSSFSIFYCFSREKIIYAIFAIATAFVCGVITHMAREKISHLLKKLNDLSTTSLLRYAPANGGSSSATGFVAFVLCIVICIIQSFKIVAEMLHPHCFIAVKSATADNETSNATSTPLFTLLNFQTSFATWEIMFRMIVVENVIHFNMVFNLVVAHCLLQQFRNVSMALRFMDDVHRRAFTSYDLRRVYSGLMHALRSFNDITNLPLCFDIIYSFIRVAFAVQFATILDFSYFQRCIALANFAVEPLLVVLLCHFASLMENEAHFAAVALINRVHFSDDDFSKDAAVLRLLFNDQAHLWCFNVFPLNSKTAIVYAGVFSTCVCLNLAAMEPRSELIAKYVDL